MSSDIYFKLADRINQFEGKIATVESFLKILREMYTEEEAEFASNMPHGGFTAGELAQMFGKDEPAITERLKTMSDKGTIFNYLAETGQQKYELTPFFPGAIEYYMLKRMEKPGEIKRVLDLSSNIQGEVMELIAKLMAEDPAKAVELLTPSPHFRTLTIDESLPDVKEVLTYESASAMIDKETSFAAMICICRDQVGPNTSGPCQVKGVPEYSCLSFGKIADFIVEHGFGRAKRITKQECKEILEACNKAGLVQNTNNFVDGLQFICNCCPCCCMVVKQARQFGPEVMINTANFAPLVDESSCTGCGDCVDRCPLGVISLKNDVAVVNLSGCVGCGNCVPECPVGCISMVRVSDKRPELGDRKIGLGSAETFGKV
ncbi:MAG: ferredoxin family protein [Deltaproteobacteria bacterium]|nr:ferredoxin family protein [Deltaproteobacteria bacterium]